MTNNNCCEENETDEIRKAFKYFKSKENFPDFTQVLDFSELNQDIMKINSINLDFNMEALRKKVFLKSPQQWKIFTILKNPGLIVIQNPFTELGSLPWIEKCLREYSEYPHKNNISNGGKNLENKAWWDVASEYLIKKENNKIINKLRWATMGYHHNWDTKEYSEENVSPVPSELNDVCRVILSGVGLETHGHYMAEAVIVNYYPPGTTLSPHTDSSEPYKEAPLLSFSFAKSAIFLIGGESKLVEPTSLFLNHGDVMIMTAQSRRCYHAVPRIMDNISEPLMRFKDILSILIEKCSNDDSLYLDLSILLTNEKTLNDLLSTDFNQFLTYESCRKDEFCVSFNRSSLIAIAKYIESIRININVRQVNKVVS